MNTQFTLSGKGTLAVVHFFPSVDSVKVVGITGAVGYIDRVMSLEEARKTYADLKENGWNKVDSSSVVDVSTLRLHIYN